MSNSTHPAQYWSGESQNGTIFMLVSPRSFILGQYPSLIAFLQINTLTEPADMFFSLTESPWIRAGRQYSVRVSPILAALVLFSPISQPLNPQDLWTHTDNGTAIRNFTAHAVPAHGVVALLLKDAGDEPANSGPPCARTDWCQDKNGTFVQ